MPFCSEVSRRDPVPIQIPTETDRTWGMGSVMTRTPLASVVISISRAGVGVMGKRWDFLSLL
jgi:hypothetical protein